jgi:hypothetical protein
VGSPSFSAAPERRRWATNWHARSDCMRPFGCDFGSGRLAGILARDTIIPGWAYFRYTTRDRHHGRGEPGRVPRGSCGRRANVDRSSDLRTYCAPVSNASGRDVDLPDHSAEDPSVGADRPSRIASWQRSHPWCYCGLDDSLGRRGRCGRVCQTPPSETNSDNGMP